MRTCYIAIHIKPDSKYNIKNAEIAYPFFVDESECNILVFNRCELEDALVDQLEIEDFDADSDALEIIKVRGFHVATNFDLSPLLKTV